MDESLFIFGLFVFFFVFAALIWCFLSTCLGLEIRSSDLWQALVTSRPPSSRPSRGTGSGLGEARRGRGRDRGVYSETGGYGYGYEMDDMGRPEVDGVTGGSGTGGTGAAFRMDEYELMNRGGPGRGFF